MKKLYLLLAAILSFTFTTPALDITINDGVGWGSVWYSASRENNEVEPGNIMNQKWDMESFYLTDTSLTMTGGYNFTIPQGYGGFRPGDLFVDYNNDGDYDLVAVISHAGSTYDVYSLGNTSDVFYGVNSASNPWKYKDGGNLVVSGESITYGSYSDWEGTHYTADLDLWWVDPYVAYGVPVTLHYTMECGNDNLMGQYMPVTTGGFGDPDPDPVPETGNTMAMLGIALLGCNMFRKKQLQ
jgi:hypothetical protein